MTDGLNRVTLLGNLCAEAELRSTSGGQAVLKIRLATNESYVDKDRNRKERVEYHSVIVWGRRAEALSRILNKGSRIFVEGGIRTTSYDDRDGNKRHKTEIVASNIILCGGTRGASPEPSAPPSTAGGGYSDDDYNPDNAAAGDDDLPW